MVKNGNRAFEGGPPTMAQHPSPDTAFLAAIELCRRTTDSITLNLAPSMANFELRYPHGSNGEQCLQEWLKVLRAADAAARWHVHQRRKGIAVEPNAKDQSTLEAQHGPHEMSPIPPSLL